MYTLLKQTARKFVAGAMMLTFVFGAAIAPTNASAQTSQIDALRAQLAALQAQLALLTGGSTSCYTYTRDLTLGSTGVDVIELQTFLQGKGFLTIPVGVSKGYFGPLTQSALARWQASVGIVPPAGYFGPITRARIATMCVVVPPSDNNDDDDNNELRGGAGSVDSYELLSGLSNEEVGEDEEDAEVAGLEIEVSDGSDINITAVRLNFDQGTADEDFEDYASEVSLWLDGEEVARVDADRFNDDNDFSSTISFDEDAIIRMEDTGELIVAISGANNIDSADVGDTWTVDFTSIRFQDADGATVSENPSTDDREFSFESFATASDAELKISSGDDDINDARVIQVSDSDDTDDVEIFSFNLEAEGDSDLTIDSLPIRFVTTGADLDAITNSVHLIVDGEEVGSESIATSATTTTLVVFDDIDFTIDAGDEVEVIVTIDVNELTGSFNEGDTITAYFGEDESDNSSFDVEDESGDNLADNDKTGSASSGTHSFYTAGIFVELVSVDETVLANDGADNDSATFTIKYDVTAFDSDIYVSRNDTATTVDTATGVATSEVVYRVDKSGTGVTDDLEGVVSFTANGTRVQSAANNSVRIQEGQTAHFTLTVTRINESGGDAGLYRMALKGISWDTDNSDADYDNFYNFDLDDYRTDYVFIN